jgi:hypothetical protein
MTDGAHDPLAGWECAVRTVGRVLGRLAGQFAGIDQERGAVRQDAEPSIAAAGAGVVDVRHPRLE